MKLAKHKDFESFLADISPTEQIICLRLRELISTHFPELREKFGYGVPYYHLNTRVCFLYPASLPYSGIETGVSFGLTRGHLLSNEQGLLHMENRKEVGYVFLQRESDIHEELLLEILHEAVLLDQEMAAQKKR